MPITLVVAASSPLTGEVLCRAFRQRRKQFKVLGCTYTRKDLLKELAKHHPKVVLVDTNVEGESLGGLRALQELRLACPATCAIMLLVRSEADQVVQAFANGARGVICTTEPFNILCKCIRSVNAGQVWANSSQLRWVLRAFEERGNGHLVSVSGKPLLTFREEQIVHMVVEGIPTREISMSLGLSSHTIKNHLFRIYNKLGISSRIELLLYGLYHEDRDSLKQSGTLTKSASR